MPQRIAIVGSGVSGLSALWALNRQGHEVHVFESQDRIGGHTHSFPWRNNQGGLTMVDTAFVLLNEKTYPNFFSFLSFLNIPTNPIRITFGLNRDGGALEWSSKSLSSFFSQRRNLLSLSMWRMLFDIIRFNLFASEVLSPSSPYKDTSIGTYLHQNGYSEAFMNNYLIPLASSLWVNDPAQVPELMPAVMLVRYFWNHHMLNIFQAIPKWLSIKGGCVRYVQKILDAVPAERVHTSAHIQKIYNDGEGVALSMADGSQEVFDRVIIATHAPDALRLRGSDASAEETAILGCFRTIPGTVVVHSDLSFMPRRRAAWSTWNYVDYSESSRSSKIGPSLTFHMNSLLDLSLDDDEHIFTTLNPGHAPDPATLRASIAYSHPVYDSKTLEAQDKMPSIQGERNIWYAGAWMEYGFHENGFTAGLKAAKQIDPNLNLPFDMIDWKQSRIETRDTMQWMTTLAKGIVLLVHELIMVCQWIVQLFTSVLICKNKNGVYI
ncbi:hypothetical protein VTL71DRAFT_15677 [Oculimacula yallundae]|uniref:Amine oxidase domain-containing protein n=1 Tax=Oculimacula yallundae TaxID=86028 RepID=A0ABR4CH87_9HELO